MYILRKVLNFALCLMCVMGGFVATLLIERYIMMAFMF